MNIGEAIELLKNGQMLRRKSWGTMKKFIFRQIPAEIHQDVVPKMQSLPDSVKKYFSETFKEETEQINAIYYNDQLALVGLSNLITSYTITVSDAMATDWEVFNKSLI